MPLSDLTITEQLWDGMKYLLMLLLGILGFNVRRLVNRVDTLEEKKAEMAALNATTSGIRSDIKECTKRMSDDIHELRGDIRDVHKRIDQIVTTIIPKKIE